MEIRIRGVRISYTEHGQGLPLIALHGAGVDHRDIEAGLEPMLPAGYRRIYPDLPGMGRTTADGLGSNNDVVTLLSDFLDEVSDEPVLLVGHSYGAYLARALAARRPDKVRGLALLCPFADGLRSVPEQHAVRSDENTYDELEPESRAGFDEYFVVRTSATARRYRDSVEPGTRLVDEAALQRIFAGWTLDFGDTRYSRPALIVAGRQDSTVGFLSATDLLEQYPNGTLAVLDGAGHALVHEQPELVAALLDDWLNRTA
ncbi:alpha/beta fold hydrolase [Mycetocola zhadangensis]|uniref:Alpha/beta hydrolase n=1 Tax=Mycetocola zhadangensis TaxID=1164595 RepID=A0A3L7IWI2_9MICO|nr:alpha/beta hydrolase [Mycetocola zhadangensis]RLQ81442.1 alpha/beta hydrolase [Mycetocola zhadangensis]GGF01608.1 2-hydroxy-6-oxo-6-phenylhexa-2,4-dienoate hydrolase [Mycetocola zhadangensis]